MKDVCFVELTASEQQALSGGGRGGRGGGGGGNANNNNPTIANNPTVTVVPGSGPSFQFANSPTQQNSRGNRG